jgi:predicted ATPase
MGLETIKKLTIEGFKSIRKLEDFELRSLNVLIGANGAGKSDFVSFFGLLRELIDQQLQLFVETSGGADALLHLGPKITKQINAKIYFGTSEYEFTLVPTNDKSAFQPVGASLGSIGRRTSLSISDRLRC